MLDMLKLSRQTGIWPQRDVIKYIRSAIAIDGLIRQFAPHFDVGHHLAVACRQYLSWHARQALCSHDALMNWSNAAAELVQHGAFRMSSFLEHVGESTDGPSGPSQRDARKVSQRAKAWELVAIAVVAALLATGTKRSLSIGANLFTAELMVAVMALTALWLGSWPTKLSRA
jgi:hypothetical protein